MRIANRKRFMFSCIFFTFLLVIIGKIAIEFNETRVARTHSTPVASINKNQYSKDEMLIVLDAGHGGIDKGTNIESLYEKDLTLKIVKNMEKYLVKEGYKVMLTRNEDKLIPLQEIGNIVNAAHGDVFVSIHINSISNLDFKGITTLYFDMNNFQKDKRIELAKLIENEAVKSDGWENRGIKKQNVAVLRYSKTPCVLVECGFITNLEDRKKLQNEQVLKNLSENISNGIIKYLDKNGSMGCNFID